MQHVEDYRQQAEACRVMAGKAVNGPHRSQLLELAVQWDKLASEREKLLETQQKLRDI